MVPGLNGSRGFVVLALYFVGDITVRQRSFFCIGLTNCQLFTWAIKSVQVHLRVISLDQTCRSLKYFAQLLNAPMVNWNWLSLRPSWTKSCLQQGIEGRVLHAFFSTWYLFILLLLIVFYKTKWWNILITVSSSEHKIQNL